MDLNSRSCAVHFPLQVDRPLAAYSILKGLLAFASIVVHHRRLN